MVAATGCRDSRRRPGESWKAEPGAVQVGDKKLDEKSPPAEVARTLVELLLKCDTVRRQGLGDPLRQQEFDEIRNQIRRLAAANEIHAHASSDQFRLMPANLTVEKAVELITNQWPSIIAYYRDGIRVDRLIEAPIEGDHAMVLIPADNPAERAAVEKIEQSLVDQRDERGQPLLPGGPAFNAARRRAAIDAGVSPNVETTIAVRLTRESGFWRVSSVRADEVPISRTFAVRLNPATTTSAPTL